MTKPFDIMRDPVPTDKPDGEYEDVWGPCRCYHCGYPWGGSGVQGRGVALRGKVVHTHCFVAASQIVLAADQLKGGAKDGA